MFRKLLPNKNAIIPYYTFGDPNPAFTKELVLKSFANGADLIELGIPFSDPIADGPVIQASHQRALENTPNIGIKEALEFVKDIKKTQNKPLIFMLSVNLVYAYGVEKFFKDAKKFQMDGAVIPDLAIEEATEFLKYAKKYQINLIFLVSPLCTSKRMQKIVQASTGFVYLISTTGTTGERKNISTDLAKISKKIKAIKNIPVIIGFGISKKEHLATVFKFTDGAIIGSHFVKKIGENPKNAIQEITEELKLFSQSTF